MVHCHKFAWSQGLLTLLELVYSAVWSHSYTGGQGYTRVAHSLGQQLCHPCLLQTIIVSFRFSTTNCFRYWYWSSCNVPYASRWCSLAIYVRDCTLNLTLKRPVNLWAVRVHMSIHASGETVISRTPLWVSSHAGVNCRLRFYCVNYSKPWKKKY